MKVNHFVINCHLCLSFTESDWMRCEINYNFLHVKYLQFSVLEMIKEVTLYYAALIWFPQLYK